MNKHIMNFGGYPICLFQTNKIPTEKNLNILRKSSKKIFQDNKPYEVSGFNYSSKFKLSDDSHIFKNKKLKNIEKILLDCYEDYVNNILQIKNEFYICNSWCTLQKKGEFHPSHTHPNHIFSAVYYAKAQKSSLIFHLERSRIQENFHFDYEIKEYNIYNSTSWFVEVNSGDVIIFPGQLKHGSSVCENDERIIVGSSLFIKGKIGYEEMYSDINLKV